MTPALLLPGALAALVALALPLLIHIARKSEQRPTDFAALRWLRERPRPRHRLRFDERLLLAVRLLLLLALLAPWLARPVLFGSADRTPWLVAVPGVDAAAARAQATGKVRAHWLAPGFPPLDAAAPVGAVPFASLLRELDATLPSDTPITALAPAVLQGADAERPRLSRAVVWKVVAGAMPTAPVAKTAASALVVRYGNAAGVRYMRAAALAQGGAQDVAPVTQPIAAGTRRLAWMAAVPLPERVTRWVEAGGTALLAAEAHIELGDRAVVVLRGRDGSPLILAAARGRGRLLRFARPLVPAQVPELLEPDFLQRLHDALDPPPPAPARVRSGDYAPLTGAAPPARPMRELRDWLALLIAAVALGERWLATSRRRSVAP